MARKGKKEEAKESKEEDESQESKMEMKKVTELLENPQGNMEDLERVLSAALKGKGSLEVVTEAELVKACELALRRLQSDENSQQPKMEAQWGIGSALILLWQNTLTEPYEVVKVPKQIFSLAVFLHNSLFAMGECREAQRRICRFCEFWWVADLNKKENFVTHALPMLLIFSLEEFAKKQDVKRVYNLRKVLQVLDLDDDSSLTLKQLLLRCFLSPLYLFTDDGIKFLSELFCLSEDFLADIHSTVKAQLSFASRSDTETGETGLVDSYAAIYFRGWKAASLLESPNELLQVIERDLIQDLMDSAIHVGDPVLADTLFLFLNHGFHENKNTKDVDQMLLRLYNPILWRALNVANHNVRFNATRILARAFPLQDPDSSVSETDELLQKQFSALEQLLTDTSPKVRVAAVQGACRMLSVYWELIPKKAVVSLISLLVGQLLHDKSSWKVRVAVLKGLEFISENPLSQPALKDILTHCSPFIHDQSKAVRNALVSLLLRVKSIRSIKFYDVVPVDHLLERLATDPQLSKKLTKLLVDSFFPQGASGADQLHRIISLLENHPRAAVAFMENLHHHISVGPVCKLTILLGKWVVNKLDCLEANEDGGESQEQLFSGAMKAIAALWESVAKNLKSSRYKTAREQMLETFNFDTFVKPMLSLRGPLSETTLPFLMEIAAHLPCDKTFQSTVLLDILRFRAGFELGTMYTQDAVTITSALEKMNSTLGPAIFCLCIWGAEDQLVEEIVRSLSKEPLKQAKKRRGPVPKSKRGVIPSEPMEPFVAMWCLQYVMANNTNGCRDRLLTEESNSYSRLQDGLKEFSPSPFAFETALKLVVHKSMQSHLREELVSEDDQVVLDRTERSSFVLPQYLTDQISRIQEEGVAEVKLDAKVKRGTGKKRSERQECSSELDIRTRADLAGVLLAVLNECYALNLVDSKSENKDTANAWRAIKCCLSPKYQLASARLQSRVCLPDENVAGAA